MFNLLTIFCLVACLCLRASCDDGLGCGVCNIVNTGINANFAALVATFRQLPNCLMRECDPTTFVVKGDVSAGTNNAVSVATCPAGTRVIDCTCSREMNDCNGVDVDLSRCTAFNALGNTAGVQVTALCAIAPPGRYVVRSITSANPTISCAPNEQLVGCFILYSGMNTELRVTQFNDDNSCSTDGICSIGLGCRLQAICRNPNI